MYIGSCIFTLQLLKKLKMQTISSFKPNNYNSVHNMLIYYPIVKIPSFTESLKCV